MISEPLDDEAELQAMLDPVYSPGYTPSPPAAPSSATGTFNTRMTESEEVISDIVHPPTPSTIAPPPTSGPLLTPIVPPAPPIPLIDASELAFYESIGFTIDESINPSITPALLPEVLTSACADTEKDKQRANLIRYLHDLKSQTVSTMFVEPPAYAYAALEYLINHGPSTGNQSAPIRKLHADFSRVVHWYQRGERYVDSIHCMEQNTEAHTRTFVEIQNNMASRVAEFRLVKAEEFEAAQMVTARAETSNRIRAEIARLQESLIQADSEYRGSQDELARVRERRIACHQANMEYGTTVFKSAKDESELADALLGQEKNAYADDRVFIGAARELVNGAISCLFEPDVGAAPSESNGRV